MSKKRGQCSSSMSNKGSRLYAVADGWIGNRCECVTSVLSLRSVLFSVINSDGPTIDTFGRKIIDNFGPALQEPCRSDTKLSGMKLGINISYIHRHRLIIRYIFYPLYFSVGATKASDHS